MKIRKNIVLCLVFALLISFLPHSSASVKAEGIDVPVITKATREGGKAHIEWGYVDGAESYQVQYSYSPDFPSSSSIRANVNYGFNTSFDIENTDMSKELYVHVRALETAKDGAKLATKYSNPIMFTGWDDTLDIWCRNSAIHSESAVMYFASSKANTKAKAICIDPMFGTVDDGSKKIMVNPRGSEKIFRDYVQAGVRTTLAASKGTTFDSKDVEVAVPRFENDGRRTEGFTAKTGIAIKDALLKEGYNVMLIRSTSTCKLDDPARCILANHYTDLHICFYYSTELVADGRGVSYYLIPDYDTHKEDENLVDYYSSYPMSNVKLRSANKTLAKCAVDSMAKNGKLVSQTERIESDTLQSYYSEVPLGVFVLGGRIEPHTDEDIELLAKCFSSASKTFLGKVTQSFRNK